MRIAHEEHQLNKNQKATTFSVNAYPIDMWPSPAGGPLVLLRVLLPGHTGPLSPSPCQRCTACRRRVYLRHSAKGTRRKPVSLGPHPSHRRLYRNRVTPASFFCRVFSQIRDKNKN